MKNTLRVIDANDARQIAQAALLQTEQAIAKLEADRETKLADAEGDYLAEIEVIDRELVSLRGNVEVHRGRIAAMSAKKVKQHRAKRAQVKTAAIDDIKTRLDRSATAGARLDQALQQVSEAFAELDGADAAVFANWPDVLPSAFQLKFCRAMIHPELSSRRPQRQLHAGLVRALATHDAFNFADMIASNNRELIDELEKAPIPESREAA